MKTSSAKAKGRRACQVVAQYILSSFPSLTPKDVTVTPSGVTGVDVQLSQKAFDMFPFCIEVKNQEKLNVWAALEQAVSHRDDNETPILFFTRNRSKMYVALEIEDFFKLYVSKKENNSSNL